MNKEKIYQAVNTALLGKVTVALKNTIVPAIVDEVVKVCGDERQGEWIKQKGGFFYLCSMCGKAQATKENYCHHCGAKMNGKETDNGR